MELLLSILLLFGAFSLGSATHENTDPDLQGLELPATAIGRQALHGTGVKAGGVESAISDCQINRHVVIYRDLTVAYEDVIETQGMGVRDSKGVYPDE